MKIIEKKLSSILKDLKDRFGIISVRSEFENEGASFKEAQKLKELSSALDLGLTIKIGGCEAVVDIYNAYKLEASSIIAPMIETSYSCKKFIQALNSIYSTQELQSIKTLINIETITGFNNLVDILTTEHIDQIDGVVLGRVDMSGSLGLQRNQVDSDTILNVAKVMSEHLSYYRKALIIGGGISIDSLSFLKNVSNLSQFETRKIVFESSCLNQSDIVQGLALAIEFELLWIANKSQLGGFIYKNDLARYKMLAQRYTELKKHCNTCCKDKNQNKDKDLVFNPLVEQLPATPTPTL